MSDNANLRKFISGMIGREIIGREAYDFDITNLIGMSCLLNIVHKNVGDTTYANIHNASPLIMGMESPVQINPSQCLMYSNFDFDIYNKLPKFLQEKIAATPEYQSLQDFLTHQVALAKEQSNSTPPTINTPAISESSDVDKALTLEYQAELLDIEKDKLKYTRQSSLKASDFQEKLNALTGGSKDPKVIREATRTILGVNKTGELTIEDALKIVKDRTKNLNATPEQLMQQAKELVASQSGSAGVPGVKFIGVR